MTRILVLMHSVLVFLGVVLFQSCGKNNEPLPQRYTVEIRIGQDGCLKMNNGPIQLAGTKTYKINEGVSLYFEFFPNWGCDVDSLIVDNHYEYVSPGYPYPLPKIMSDHTLDVTFKKNVYGLIASNEPWVRDSVYIKNPDGSWTGHVTGGNESIRFWRPGKRYKVYNEHGEISQGHWSLNGNDISGKIETVSDENPAVITLDGSINHIMSTSWTVQEVSDEKLKVILTSYDAPENAMNYRFVFTHPVR